MRVEYGLLSLFLAFAYGLIVKFFPDFPVSPDVLLAFLVYVLLKLGVIVVGVPAFAALQRSVKRLFARKG